MEPVSVKAILHSPLGVLFVKNPRNEWELPGGRPEAGESLEAALLREVQEECGLTVAAPAYVCSQSCEIIPDQRVLLVFFSCECATALPRLHLSEEHTDYRWVEMAGELPSMLPDYYWQACQRARTQSAAVAPRPAV